MIEFIEFIAILVVLGVVYFAKVDFTWCNFNFVDSYQSLLRKGFGQYSVWRGFSELFFVVLSLAVIVCVLNWVFSGSGNLVYLLFETVVLFYCIASTNIRQHVKKYVSLMESDQQQGFTYAREVFHADDDLEVAPRHAGMTAVLQSCNQSFYSTIFWFLLLGPVGATIYRLMHYFANEQRQELETQAKLVQNILDWIPARLFGLSLALISHFPSVIAGWLRYVAGGLASNPVLLTACGFAALGIKESEDLNESEFPEKDLISVIDRSLLIWLVVIALLTISAMK